MNDVKNFSPESSNLLSLLFSIPVTPQTIHLNDITGTKWFIFGCRRSNITILLRTGTNTYITANDNLMEHIASFRIKHSSCNNIEIEGT